MSNKIDTVYVLCLSEIHFCKDEELVDYNERLNNVLGIYVKFADAIEAALLYSIRNNTTLDYKGYSIIYNTALQIWYKNETGNDICKEFRILRRRIK